MSESDDGRPPRTLEGAQLHALLPHRAPFLFVDRVEMWRATPKAQLRASFHVPPEHPLLAGHFPEDPIWPGSLTGEGLAQACNLLGALVQRQAAASSASPSATNPSEPTGPLRGLLAEFDLRFNAVVRPGDTLSYFVRLELESPTLSRFRVEAYVGAQTVAHGRVGAHHLPAPAS